MKQINLWLFTLFSIVFWSDVMALPSGFVYLNTIDPSIIQDVKYFSSDNFIGRPIAGYHDQTCIITLDAALALKKVQQQLLEQGRSLKVFDCYRPQQAVDDFIVWSKDKSDVKMKKIFYPNVDKADFFKLGYVAEASDHTRGSTADLTIVDLTNTTLVELDMGTHFDFMDERSHVFAEHISESAKENRLFLRALMQEAGFMPYEKEWWHFTLKNEKYPDTYFNFPVL